MRALMLEPGRQQYFGLGSDQRQRRPGRLIKLREPAQVVLDPRSLAPFPAILQIDLDQFEQQLEAVGI
jgi:hypothetical protein